MTDPVQAPDGSTLVTADTTGDIRVWNLGTQTRAAPCAHSTVVSGCSVGADGAVARRWHASADGSAYRTGTPPGPAQ